MQSELPVEAVILAGGRGTRLAPYTMAFPKPLVPLGELPIIEIVLRQLAWYGIRRAHISVGYLASLIEAYFATKGSVPGLEINYLRESRPLGTAGAISLAPNNGQDLLVVNGDVLTTLNFSDVVFFHRKHRPALTIAVRPRAVTIDLGVLEIDDSSYVSAYKEKPTNEYLCSMGVYLYGPEAIDAVKGGEPLDFPDLVLHLLAEGQRVLAYKTDCYWLDIGRHGDYEQAAAEFTEMRSRLLPDDQLDVDNQDKRPQGDGA